MHPEKDFGLWEMTSEIAAPFLEGSDVEVERHRREEILCIEQFERNLVSRDLGNKKMRLAEMEWGGAVVGRVVPGPTSPAPSFKE